jgi:hypothetical protein
VTALTTPAQFDGFRPGRLWSLFDMINFGLGSFVTLYDSIRRLETYAAAQRSAPTPSLSIPPHTSAIAALLATQSLHVTDSEVGNAKSVVRFAEQIFQQLEMARSLKRAERLKGKLEYPALLSYTDYEVELRTLREAMEDDANECFFYSYPKAKVHLLQSAKDQWKNTNEKFESARKEILQAVDCFACNHWTASVFHLMRIAEYGLRALARERGVTFPKARVELEWADWQNLIDGIKTKVELLAKKRRGAKRGAALEFYRGALGSFEGFKDAFRNEVMHSRVSYDEGKALSCLNNVRDFMERLAAKIGEKPKAIKWGIK